MHMMEKFNTYVNNIKKLFNKDITEQVTKYRIPLITAVIVILLACISIFVTYAFYKVEDVTPIVGGSTGDIADLDLRIMVEGRNSDGSAKVGEYILYPYIPQAGYEYNEAKSYCTNGSTINYNEDIYDVDIIIYCMKNSHKGIIIGKDGNMLKRIASYSRQKIEKMLDIKVNMNIWVKVQEDWQNRENIIKSISNLS